MTTNAGGGSAGRPHSLAPAELGDVRAGAALAIAVLGVAVFIAGVGIVVAGLTAGSAYDPATAPPNVADLGTWQVVGGFVLFVVGVALAGGALGLLAGGHRARIPTAILALASAVAAIGAGIAIVVRGPSDLVLAISLFGLGLGLGGAGLLLLRPRR
ncbi:MAG: hypothetical protein ACRDFZ_07910 [Candidatus Limnocylindria bacterium]